MTNIRNAVSAAVALCFLIGGLTACEKEGPAERAGKAIDKSVDTAGKKIEKAGEQVQEAARDAKQ